MPDPQLKLHSSRALGLPSCPCQNLDSWWVPLCQCYPWPKYILCTQKPEIRGDAPGEGWGTEPQAEFFNDHLWITWETRSLNLFLQGFAFSFFPPFLIFAESQWLAWIFSSSPTSLVFDIRKLVFLVPFQDKTRGSWNWVGEPVFVRFSCWEFQILGQRALSVA